MRAQNKKGGCLAATIGTHVYPSAIVIDANQFVKKNFEKCWVVGQLELTSCVTIEKFKLTYYRNSGNARRLPLARSTLACHPICLKAAASRRTPEGADSQKWLSHW
jgi:hypothetical protein